LISHFLLRHAPKGISQEYIPILILQNGPAMRAAQQKISTRMFKLLGLTLGGHHDAPLVPSLPNAKKAKPPRRVEIGDGWASAAGGKLIRLLGSGRPHGDHRLVLGHPTLQTGRRLIAVLHDRCIVVAFADGLFQFLRFPAL
jgi:hypothetical protein